MPRRPRAPARIPCPERRSHCPIACTLDLVGDRWTLLVARDLLLGKTRFDEFLAGPEKIATNILAARLKWLLDRGFAERTPDPVDARKAHYRLTDRGQRLGTLLRSIADWGLAEIESTTTDPRRVRL